MRRNYLNLGFAAAVLLLLASDTVAGLSAYETRTIPSADGAYLLVLLTPEEAREYRWPKTISEQERIEKLYSQSGLYRNDGSTELLWPIQYFPTCKDIYVCNDGIHLAVAFLGWDGSTSDRGNALEFYANGQQLASYNEDRLLVGYVARIIFSNLFGVDYPTGTTAKLDEKSQTFEIETNWRDAFRFNIATGKLVNARLPWSFKACFVLMGVLVSIFAWWFWRRIVQRKRAT